MSQTSVVEQILDLARWAPSGDNAQPWRFEVVGDRHFVIHGRDTRDHCIYDLDGRPSQLALGALIETAAIAASRHGLGLSAARRKGMPEHLPTFDITLTPDAQCVASPLLAQIPQRRVQRRALSTRPLSDTDREALQAAAGPGYQVVWFGSWPDRLRWASLLWANAGLRLRLPEAFETHRSVIEWDASFSKDRIPDQALGADRLTIALMRKAMHSWQRIAFLNRWLGGTIAPRIAMDMVPALACAAHVAIVADRVPADIDDHVASGRAVQRLWLTATKLGLQHQPSATPLVFARYLREGRHFTQHGNLVSNAQTLATRLETLLGQETHRTVWLGRLGHGVPATARSLRRPLEELLTHDTRQF